MNRADAVFLDLDGTLLDTAGDMVGALNRLRLEESREPLPFEPMRSCVPHGAIRLVSVGFPEASGDRFEQLRRRFLDLYAERLADETRLFDGFDAVLEALESRGVPWGIVTNKPGWLTDPLLERLGLAARACSVVSGDTVAERKPHPLPLLHAARVAGVEPRRCIYVGDAERDIVAGRAAGMRTLVAAYGYLGPEDRPEAWGAHGIVERPDQLLEWLTLTHLDRAAAS